MTSFRDAAATRLMVLTAAGTFYPTGRAIGAAKASGGVFVSTDTLSGTNTDSVFQSGNTKYAVIHRIYVVTAGTNIKLQAAQTNVDLTPTYDTTVVGTVIDFSPGVIIPQGFRVVTTGAGTIHIVYSLLEN
jgi:hypothetical protein